MGSKGIEEGKNDHVRSYGLGCFEKLRTFGFDVNTEMISVFFNEDVLDLGQTFLDRDFSHTYKEAYPVCTKREK